MTSREREETSFAKQNTACKLAQRNSFRPPNLHLMSDDLPPRNDGPNRRNQEPQFNWKGFLLLSVVVLLVGSALMVGKEATRAQPISYKEFKKLVEDDMIDRSKDLLLVQADTTSAEMIEGYKLTSKVLSSTNEPDKISPVDPDAKPVSPVAGAAPSCWSSSSSSCVSRSKAQAVEP
jgi:hypothetical protein